MKKELRIFMVILGSVWIFPVFAQAAQEIEIVFDASRSMNELAGNQSKLDAAKKSIATVADQIVPGSKVGLRVFGTAQVKENVRESCFDSKLLMPIAGYDKATLIMDVMGFQALGQTPLGYSLELAGKDFTPAPEIQKTIILISDGEESCGKNPVAVVKNLQIAGEEGLSLLKAMLTKQHNLPVAVFSAYVTPELEKQAYEAGAVDVIHKNIGFDVLLGKIHRILAARHRLLGEA